MSDTVIVICELCGERIAQTTLESLSYPVKGSMFTSVDPVHGVPDPWQPYEQWVDELRCPYGRNHRFMTRDNKVLTDKGLVVIPRDGAPSRFKSTAEPEPEMDFEEKMKAVTEGDGSDNGEAEAQQGQPDNGESVEEKKEEVEGPVAEPEQSMATESDVEQPVEGEGQEEAGSENVAASDAEQPQPSKQGGRKNKRKGSR